MLPSFVHCFLAIQIEAEVEVSTIQLEKWFDKSTPHGLMNNSALDNKKKLDGQIKKTGWFEKKVQ